MAHANATDIVGWAYEADVHCVDCANKRFNDEPEHGIDGEGNEVTPIFNGEDAYEECGCCGGSGSHATKCASSETYDCDDCDGNGVRSLCCGDCGAELVW